MRHKNKHKTIETLQREQSQREKKMKSVKINDRLWILVSRKIPDEEAIENFILKDEDNRRKFDNRQVYRRWE